MLRLGYCPTWQSSVAYLVELQAPDSLSETAAMEDQPDNRQMLAYMLQLHLPAVQCSAVHHPSRPFSPPVLTRRACQRFPRTLVFRLW